MPEGVEIAILAENLLAILNNVTLIGIKILGGRYKHKDPTNFKLFTKNLPLNIKNVSSRGKFLYITLSDSNSNEFSIWNTFGLTGKWLFEKQSHSHIEFTFKKNYTPRPTSVPIGLVSPTGQQLVKNGDLPYYAPVYELVIPDSIKKADIFKMYYTDVRRFGTFTFCDSDSKLQAKLKTMKYDILHDNIDFKTFKMEFAKKKKTNITKVLMNPRLFSGIGNYIKTEALYLAKLSPKRTADTLTDSDLKSLLKSIKYIMKLSYKSQYGINNYLSDTKITGKTFKFLVYQKKKDPQGNSIEALKTPDKRTTYWSPMVQK